MAQHGLANGSHAAHVPHDSALSVGSSKEEDAARIRDLEDEVRVLAEKANGASQRFADYENEIRVLEAKLRQEQRKNSAPTIAKVENVENSPTTPSPTAQAADRPGISRFGSFIGSRNKPFANQQNGAPLPPTGSREKELEEKLIKEQTTRIAAEKKVKEVNAEIEDLSATLFQQANEMVAQERKENASLKEQLQRLEQEKSGVEEKVQSLEEQKQILKQQKGASVESEQLAKENSKLKEKLERLEQREVDRKRRIERLESATRRIERVKAMLQPP